VPIRPVVALLRTTRTTTTLGIPMLIQVVYMRSRPVIKTKVGLSEAPEIITCVRMILVKRAVVLFIRYVTKPLFTPDSKVEPPHNLYVIFRVKGLFRGSRKKPTTPFFSSKGAEPRKPRRARRTNHQKQIRKKT
jgi:hypothetical protein